MKKTFILVSLLSLILLLTGCVVEINLKSNTLALTNNQTYDSDSASTRIHVYLNDNLVKEDLFYNNTYNTNLSSGNYTLRLAYKPQYPNHTTENKIYQKTVYVSGYTSIKTSEITSDQTRVFKLKIINDRDYPSDGASTNADVYVDGKWIGKTMTQNLTTTIPYYVNPEVINCSITHKIRIVFNPVSPNHTKEDKIYEYPLIIPSNSDTSINVFIKDIAVDQYKIAGSDYKGENNDNFVSDTVPRSIEKMNSNDIFSAK